MRQAHLPFSMELRERKPPLCPCLYAGATQTVSSGCESERASETWQASGAATSHEQLRLSMCVCVCVCVCVCMHTV